MSAPGRPDEAGQSQLGSRSLSGGGDEEEGSGEGGCSVGVGDGEGDGDGDGEGDADGFGEGLGAGLRDGLRFGEGEENVVGSRAGGVDVASTAGDDEDAAALGEGFGEDGDANGEDSRTEICCTAATEWAEVRGPGPLSASAVLAATTALTPTAMATRNPVIRRNSEIRSIVLPWSAGGAPDSHSAASSSAASPSCDRPRRCQSRP